MNRDNLPPEGVSLTECTPDAAGFIAGEHKKMKKAGRQVSPVMGNFAGGAAAHLLLLLASLFLVQSTVGT